MFSLRRPIANTLLIITFLVLAIIASAIYSGNKEQRAKAENNIWYQKTKSVITTLLYISGGLGKANFDSRTGIGQEVAADGLAVVEKSNFWEKFMTRLKTEWQKSQVEDQVGAGETVDENSADISGNEDAINLENGGEIVEADAVSSVDDIENLLGTAGQGLDESLGQIENINVDELKDRVNVQYYWQLIKSKLDNFLN